VNNFFDFLNLYYFDDFFNDLFDRNDLWDLNNSVDNLFDDLLNFNNLGNNSEDLQYVINVNDSHDLLIDHTNNSFIDLENSSSSSFEFFEFFQKSFDQNSEMELYFSGFFAGVSIHVFDSDHIRHVLNDFDDSVQLIYFDDINKFLLEEFVKSCITLFSEFGILFEVFLHLHCEHVN
jgi:hypothetical protein